jgi:hypothetical protein
MFVLYTGSVRTVSYDLVGELLVQGCVSVPFRMKAWVGKAGCPGVSEDARSRTAC